MHPGLHRRHTTATAGLSVKLSEGERRWLPGWSRLRNCMCAACARAVCVQCAVHSRLGLHSIASQLSVPTGWWRPGRRAFVVLPIVCGECFCTTVCNPTLGYMEDGTRRLYGARPNTRHLWTEPNAVPAVDGTHATSPRGARSPAPFSLAPTPGHATVTPHARRFVQRNLHVPWRDAARPGDNLVQQTLVSMRPAMRNMPPSQYEQVSQQIQNVRARRVLARRFGGSGAPWGGPE